MKTRILAACVAALTFRCTQPAPVSPSPRVASPPAPRIVTPAVATVVLKDGGMDFDVEARPIAEDVVALRHQHRGSVDHLGRADELRSLGDLKGALAEARRAVYDDPDDEKALYQTALLAKSTRQRDIAIEAFERLGRIRTEDPEPLLQEARLLVKKHDDDGAIEVATEARVRDPENAESFEVEGLAHLHKGELKEAIDAFSRCLEIDPTHGYAMNNLGLAFLRANQNEKALEFLVQAAETLPNVAYIQNNLGVALERLGKLDEAKLAYGRATSLSPKYVKAQINALRVKKLANAVDEPSHPEDGSSPDDPPAPIPPVDVEE